MRSGVGLKSRRGMSTPRSTRVTVGRLQVRGLRMWPRRWGRQLQRGARRECVIRFPPFRMLLLHGLVSVVCVSLPWVLLFGMFAPSPGPLPSPSFPPPPPAVPCGCWPGAAEAALRPRSRTGAKRGEGPPAPRAAPERPVSTPQAGEGAASSAAEAQGREAGQSFLGAIPASWSRLNADFLRKVNVGILPKNVVFGRIHALLWRGTPACGQIPTPRDPRRRICGG